MLRLFRRIAAWILSCLLFLSANAFPRAALPEESGAGFDLAVVTANRTVIEPEWVPVQPGETIRDALLGTAHDWSWSEDGTLYAADGVQAGYVLYDDGGGYDLSAPANGIRALLIGVRSRYSVPLLTLVQRMGEYRRMTNGVQNYPAAKAAYADALEGLRDADAGTAQRLLDALNGAVAQYTALLQGEKYHVVFDAAVPLSGVLTDAYGNETPIVQSEADVTAGDYTFSVHSGDTARTEGAVTVTQNLTVPVELPVGAWFGEVQLLREDKTAYAADQTAQTTTIYIPDHTPDVCLYVPAGDVPDAETTRLYARYVGTNGTDQSTVSRSWNSRSVRLPELLTAGMQGRTFTLEACFTDGKGFVQIETHTVSIFRVPTLTELTVLSDGADLLAGFDRDAKTYTLPCVSDTLTIDAKADEDYAVTIDGTPCTRADIHNDGGVHAVTVSALGQTTVYTLQLQRKDSVTITLRVPDDTTAVLQTEAGGTLTPIAENTYRVIPETDYKCVASCAGVYHTAVRVSAASDTVIDVPKPDCTDALDAFRLYDRSNAATRKAYLPAPAFDAAVHTYTVTVSDMAAVLYAQASTAAGCTVTAVYPSSADGRESSVRLTSPVSDTGSAVFLTGCLARGGASQTITLRVSRTADDTEIYQTYTLHIRRALHLTALAVYRDDAPVTLLNDEGNAVSFDRDTAEYTLLLPQQTQSVRIDVAFPVDDGAYSLSVGSDLPLDPDKAEESIAIGVRHTDKDAQSGVYTLRFVKVSAVRLTIDTVPADACVFLTRARDGQRVDRQGGAFPVYPGEQYACTVTANGFVGQKIDPYTAPQSDTTLRVTLQTAPAGAARPQYDAVWPSFRANRNNNGVTTAATPTDPQDAVLYWAAKIGDGTSADACGCPILVNGDLYTYAGTTLYRIDAASGEVLQTGQMHHASGFALNTPTYADGMLFVGLADGAIQAFNAETLESLWLYTDALGGQPNSPITYADGYLYTGFWQGETQNANYVCLSVTDEDPSSPDEAKLAGWTYTHTGGFYWSGAYVTDNAVLIAADDGQSGYTTGFAPLISLDPRSGRVLDAVTMPLPGDIRSGVMYDAQTDACYFTSKGGWFGKIRLLADGTLDETSLQCLTLQNGTSSASPAMSTSTPVIYNARAYIGVSGSSQFGMYSGHNITVIDLAHMEIAYTVPTQGYPQASGLLTTAYDTGDGTVYVYFFDNYTPGKLRCLRDRPGQTKPDRTQEETYLSEGRTYTSQAAPVLFTPYDTHAQHTICSPIADENGTIYFKNDTGYLFAVGHTPLSLTVVTPPEKTTYTAGESFCADGMQVLARFADGSQRDVSAYIRYPQTPLSTDDTDFRIVYPIALYHDGQNGPGTRFAPPSAVLTLRILPLSVQGDADGDGDVTAADGDLVYAYYNGECPLTPEQLARSDMNGDGRITAVDAAMIYKIANTDS